MRSRLRASIVGQALTLLALAAPGQGAGKQAGERARLRTLPTLAASRNARNRQSSRRRQRVGRRPPPPVSFRRYRPKRRRALGSSRALARHSDALAEPRHGAQQAAAADLGPAALTPALRLPTVRLVKAAEGRCRWWDPYLTCFAGNSNYALRNLSVVLTERKCARRERASACPLAAAADPPVSSPPSCRPAACLHPAPAGPSPSCRCRRCRLWRCQASTCCRSCLGTI